MIQGEKALLEWFKCNSTHPYWVIFQNNEKSRGNAFSKSEQIPNLAHESSYEQLKKVLGILPNDVKFYVVLYSQTGSNTDLRETWYIHKKDFQSESQQVQIPNQIGWLGDEKSIEDKINKGIEDFKIKLRLEALEAENNNLKKELREAQPNPLEAKIAGLFDKYPQVPEALLGYLVPKKAQVGIAGFKESSANETVDSAEQIRLENALEKWAKVDNDFFLVIEKIAELAATNPQYTMYKNMILGM